MNIAIAQSGGPTSAINASLVGVYKEALKHVEIDKIYGSLNGIEGILYDNLVNLKDIVKTDDDLDLLKITPSSALGSCRYKLPKFDVGKDVYDKIIDCFNKYDIKIFFYIGGNDSMDTVMTLSSYLKTLNSDIKVIGVPKTIDNDLPITDHTPGFGSAAKYVACTISELARDCSVYRLKYVTIVEIMGRHAGWLTASSCVLHANGESAPHLIYLPENEFTLEKFLNDVRKKLETTDSVIIALSEGVKLKDQKSVSATFDSFGHEQLSGIGKTLENIVKEQIGCKVRSIELNILQRCAGHLSSKVDLDEAEEIGMAAVKAVFNGISGHMMYFKRVQNNPYKIEIDSIDAKEVANKTKYFPSEWVNEEKNGVKKEALDYFLPLIQGEVEPKTKNGIITHFIINK